MTTTQKTIDKYESIIDSGRFAEREIISFRSLLNKSMGRWCRNPDERATYLVNRFHAAMPRGGYALDPAQQAKGVSYLKSQLFKRDGGRRNNAFARSAPEIVFDVLQSYSHFTFVGLEDWNGHGWLVPVYRCWAQDGSYFDYLGVSWRQTAGMEVIGLDRASRPGSEGWEVSQ